MGDKEGLLAAALERLRTATTADAAGETARAVAEYDAGVALLARAAVRARTPDERAMLCAKCAEYGARADTLRSALPPSVAPAAVAGAPSTSTMTTTNNEDAELEARIARLPRLGGSIPSAPDPLPPQRPQTEEEQADDLVREALESAALERRYGPPPSVSSDSESDDSNSESDSSDESSNTDDDKEEDERMKREDEKEEAELQAALEVLLREPRGSPAARAAAAVVRRRLHGNTARHEAAERAYIARRTREEREREQAARARWLRKQRK